MKKIIIKTLMIFIFLCFSFVINESSFVKAYSSNIESNLETKMNEIFEEKEISEIDYLYNFDDKPIFIYIDFIGGGYSILSIDCSTILEYSLSGNGPYYNIDKKYYCGPTYYLSRISKNEYYNSYDNQEYYLSDNQLLKINQDLETIANVNAFNYEIETENLDNINLYRSLDNVASNSTENNIIQVATSSTTVTKYISNSNYFTSNPMHGVNQTGTCGAIAAQLILGYHNYYSDRRIISSNFLNGGWNNLTGDNDIYNSLNYNSPNENPNACANPNTMNWKTLGTTGVNETDSGTYFKYLVDKIPAWSTTTQVKNGIISALNERNNISYQIDSEYGTSSVCVDKNYIKNEINSERPTIILMQKSFGGSDHYVVAYGYQDVTDSLSGSNYTGFFTHFGYSSEIAPYKVNVWINSLWCYSYISLQINHTHNYNIVTNNIINNSTIEVRCGECGHRKLDELFVLSGNTIIDMKYDFMSTITIPSHINGIEVKGIGSEAFKNCANLEEVIIPNTVTSIDSYAFEGCTNLVNITLSNNLCAIGVGAFKGCTSLEEIEIPASVQCIDSGAFQNCSSLKSVTLSANLATIGASAFKGCTNLDEVIIPNTVTNIDSYAFEGCTNLESVTLSNSLYAIGVGAFKGCTSLEEIEIPAGVQCIDSGAFQNCSNLKSVTLSANLATIGASAFKGCTNLDEVIIPNTVTNIDSYAFEGCTNLESVTLSNSLYAIGVGAFKGCTSLEEIEIPVSVQNIDSGAFQNCSNLTSVIVKRAVNGITNLGNNVFDGCSTSLQIVVPQDRIAEYKNKVYWSSYRSKIIPDNSSYSEIELYCLIDEDDSVTLNAGYNKLYKLVVECTRSYKFVTDASSKIIVYNSDMTVAYSGNNSLPAYLNKGSYYLSIEHSTVTTSGTIKINYEPAYNPDGIAIAYNSSNGTNIASGLHLTDNNIYHARLKYTNYNGAGFYKFTLNAGASAIYPVNAIQVYTDANRTNLLSMYSLSELDIFAQSNENENIMYIYLPENGTYYIDVTLPLSSYSTLTFNIQSIEVNNINYLNSLTSIDFDVLFENVNTQSCFEEVTISHRSEIQLDIISSGTIYNDIKVYVFEKVRDPGYEPGINYYYIESVYIDEITSTNRSPVFTLILDPGTYYFGYAENEDAVNINFALRRMVDYNMNMQGILVADPYYTGYDLGTEVLFNSGECDEYTITEGFTRNIYLMVEDRLRDPMSRLDYDWYSSNENVAIVTNYGTVLAMSVTEDTTVTIYAVLKDDPKVVYYRTFTVLNDEEEDLIEIELNMSYSYVAENGTYQLELTNTNCPYPMIQYYNWSINVPCQENDISVTMGAWGYITASGPGIAIITGTYELNPRVTIIINLTITE
ncbi:MAG: leucine-rich repeat domain-containing protein [Erysipelotrichaceae bacterium]|nr:leucine-rich repeat domain-containing protein [Erysipelotrichaceae bacterium]